MGLFEKKFCDICGQKIGLFGNNKLADGNICDDCRKKLSPWFTGRKKTSLEAIKEQLAYREANQEKVAAFTVTHTYGFGGTKVLLDEDHRKFLVTSASDWKKANPDVLDFIDITGVETDIHESSRELKQKDKEGKEVSFDPPRYEDDYDFYVTIHVNNPYFDEMEFKVNDSDVTEERRMKGPMRQHMSAYKTAEAEMKAIAEALENLRSGAREEQAEAARPKASVICPFCGASTIPDAAGRCEYCGGAVNS